MIGHRILALISLVVILAAIIIKKPFSRSAIYEVLSNFYNKFFFVSSKIELFTSEELVKFNGIDRSELYLSILGNVFDVTTGQRHYGVGGQYRFFIGKDGSRSYINGNFDDDGPDRDHVLDFNCDELSTLTNWVDVYKKSYIYKGKLIGRYYHRNGKMTNYAKDLRVKLKKCKEASEYEKMQNKKFPPCNLQWTAGTGFRVWCTKYSGGVARDWSGVPRQLYLPGSKTPKCVCIRSPQENLGATLKEYNGCSKSSRSCEFTNENDLLT